MAPRNIKTLIGGEFLLAVISQYAAVLVAERKRTLVPVPDPVGRRYIQPVSSIRINIGAGHHIEIIVQHLIVTQSFQSEAELFICIECRRQQARMTSG